MIKIWVCLKNTWSKPKKDFFIVNTFSLDDKFLKFITIENKEYTFLLEDYNWGIS